MKKSRPKLAECICPRIVYSLEPNYFLVTPAIACSHEDHVFPMPTREARPGTMKCSKEEWLGQKGLPLSTLLSPGMQRPVLLAIVYLSPGTISSITQDASSDDAHVVSAILRNAFAPSDKLPLPRSCDIYDANYDRMTDEEKRREEVIVFARFKDHVPNLRIENVKMRESFSINCRPWSRTIPGHVPRGGLCMLSVCMDFHYLIGAFETLQHDVRSCHHDDTRLPFRALIKWSNDRDSSGEHKKLSFVRALGMLLNRNQEVAARHSKFLRDFMRHNGKDDWQHPPHLRRIRQEWADVAEQCRTEFDEFSPEFGEPEAVTNSQPTMNVQARRHEPPLRQASRSRSRGRTRSLFHA